MHGLNTYDYGARQYHSLVGRWDRMDPLCEKYYSVSPYAYCLNNPIAYIDSEGKEAKISGTRAERIAILTVLQALTNDKLAVSRSSGKLSIRSRGTMNKGKNLSVGTNLIRDIINDERTMTIYNHNGEFYEHDHRRKDATNGKGSDVDVWLNLSENEMKFTTRDSKTGKVKEECINIPIATGHELIHGVRAMNGVAKEGKAQNSWKDNKGNIHIQTTNLEELETTGLKGNYKYTENKLRQEQKENIRIKY